MLAIDDALIARLRLINPAITSDEARRAFRLLYAADQEWRPFYSAFSVPSTVVHDLASLAADGIDVCPHIARWLDQIGVTQALIEQLPPPYVPPQRRFEITRADVDSLRTPDDA